jgi:uncharacterized membrane protein
MSPDMTPERSPTIPFAHDRPYVSERTDLDPERLVRHAQGRNTTLLVALLGVGALWVWSRPRAGGKPKRRPDMPTLAAGRGLHVERTVTVQRSAEELYRAWRDLESLPRLAPGYLVSVTPAGDRRTRWVVAGPGRLRANWEAELTADEPGRLIAWRSVPGASVDIGGSVRFDPAPGNRGTEIKVILTYSPPGGKLGAAAAALTGGGGDRLVREALRRFKQLMEAGEIAEAFSRPESRDASTAADRAARSA